VAVSQADLLIDVDLSKSGFFACLPDVVTELAQNVI
jgi:hypothetical protein